MVVIADIDYILAAQRQAIRAANDLERQLAEVVGDTAAKAAVEAYIAEQSQRIREENPDI